MRYGAAETGLDMVDPGGVESTGVRYEEQL
jgi:hypothetical protein